MAATGTSKNLRIRPYQAADFDTLCEIDRACYEPAITYSRREMRAYLNAPGADCEVAEFNSQIRGFCITTRKDDEGYIVTIDVLEPFRKSGVGTALLAESEKRLAAAGVRRMALDTAVDNLSAIAFWQKHGYRKIGVRKGYYPNGRDAFAMVKTL
ncbi:MAG TPA: N-acetyltransferase [Candidatus Aquilonibacter sp.]|nr:N-acetyltransferase [Candidatus Aquilonibacter sp.]